MSFFFNTNIWQILLLMGYYAKATNESNKSKALAAHRLLLESLFKGHEFRRHIIPTPGPEKNNTLTINFGLTLKQIIELDAKHESLRTSVDYYYEWEDTTLIWNASDYEGITKLRVSPSLIWTPDIAINNSVGEKLDNRPLPDINVHSDGNCTWFVPDLVTTSCPHNVTWFPFDYQTCLMSFWSNNYLAPEMDIQPMDSKPYFYQFVPDEEWNLIEAHIKRTEEYGWVYLVFTIVLQRLTRFYIFNLIMPAALIAALSLLTLVLPVDSGEKISLGLTVLLSLTFFQKTVSDMVPVSSVSIPHISAYFTCLMFVCAFSVAMTVMVMNFHHRSPDIYVMPVWFQKVFCKWLARLLRMSLPKQPSNATSEQMIRLQPSATGSSDPGADDPVERSHSAAILHQLKIITSKIQADEKQATESTEWKFAASVIDRLFFWILLLFHIILSIVIFTLPAARMQVEDTVEGF